jgi:hypothetical protein
MATYAEINREVKIGGGFTQKHAGSRTFLNYSVSNSVELRTEWRYESTACPLDKMGAIITAIYKLGGVDRERKAI